MTLGDPGLGVNPPKHMRPHSGYVWVWKDLAGETWICLGRREPKLDERRWTIDRRASRLSLWGRSPVLPSTAMPEHVLLTWVVKAHSKPRLVKFSPVPNAKVAKR